MGKRWMAMSALLLVGGSALAAEDVTQRAQRCASIADSLERLVCYDRLFAPGATGPAASGAGPVSTPVQPPAAPPAARAPTNPAPAVAGSDSSSGAGTTGNSASDFGADQLRRSDARDAEAGPRTLTATIQQLRETRPNVFLMSLDNGQVWQQMDMDSLFHVKEGDTVEINRGRMGGYRMARKSRGGSGWVRVTRVK